MLAPWDMVSHLPAAQLSSSPSQKSPIGIVQAEIYKAKNSTNFYSTMRSEDRTQNSRGVLPGQIDLFSTFCIGK